MQIHTHRLADVHVVQVMGRVDHETAAAFDACLSPVLAEAGGTGSALVLDFSGVDYISSVGLRVLMVAARQMRERQAALAICSLCSVVAEIFAISRFDRVLAVHPTLDAALDKLSAPAAAAYRAAGMPSAP